MNNKPSAILICLFLYSGIACGADFTQLVSSYKSSLAEGENGMLKRGDLSETISEEIPRATPSEIASMEPVIHECLRSTSRTLRGEGLGLLFVVSIRPDSISLLDPYIDDIIKLLDDSDYGIRNMAISVLGNGNPRPAVRSLTALRAQLNAPANSGPQFRLIAASLLRAYPADTALLHEVLADVAKRSADHLDAEIILALGNLKISLPESLAFIRAGFADPSLRESSIQAVGDMPKDVRDTFILELQSTLADVSADPITRNEAAEVLMQK